MAVMCVAMCVCMCVLNTQYCQPQRDTTRKKVQTQHIAINGKYQPLVATEREHCTVQQLIKSV